MNRHLLAAGLSTLLLPMSQYAAAADTAPPVVQSIALSGSPAANASSVTYTVAFDESASQISTDDFQVTTVSGSATGTVASVSVSSGTSVDVTVNTISGTGTIRLDLKANTDIIDATGNGNNTNGFVAAYTSADTHAVDRNAPSVTSINRVIGAITNAPSVDYTVTFDENVTGFDTLDLTLTSTGTADGTIATVTPVNGSTYTVSVNSVTGDGTLRLNLNGSGTGITDSVGNAVSGGFTSGQTYTIDNTGPAAPSAPDLTAGSDRGTSNTDDLTNDQTPTFTGTAEAGATVRLYANGTEVASGTADGTGIWSITSGLLDEGTYDLTARAQDAAGNLGARSSSLSVTIDTTGPVVSTPDLAAASDSGSSNTDNITNVRRPEFTGTAPAGTLVRLFIDNAGNGNPTDPLNEIIGTGTAGADGTWSITATVDLPPWTSSIKADGQDNAGNVGGSFSSVNVTIDITPPAAVPSVPDLATGSDSGSSNTDNITNDITPTFSGTHTANNVVRLYANGALVGSATANGVGDWTITSDALDAGTYSFAARGVDLAGNEGTASTGVSVTIDTDRPTVSNVSAPANATYSTGQNLDFTVNTNENVTVGTATGTPQITLTIGATTRQAVYLSGSGTSALVFRHTVQAGDMDTDGIAVAVNIDANSGTLRDAAGNDMTLTLNSVGDTSAVLVDTGEPINNLPAAQSTNSVTQLVFSSANGNAISVADAGSLTVVISVDSGTLTASTGGAAGISNNGTGMVTMTGTAAEVNAALEGLIYTPDGAGTRTFNIQSTDSGGNVDDDDLEITVDAGALVVTSRLDTDDDETAASSFAADQADGNGLSIREALHWARAEDAITFDLDSGTPGSQGGTIVLNGNPLTIAYGNLAIDGDLDDDGVADVTVSGNNANRVLQIDASLSGIEIAGLTLTEGAVSGGGAGLYIGTGSAVTVRNSNITNNTEANLGGGGVFGSSVTLTMIHSTVSGNSSSVFGGGLRIVGAGGMLNLINSTVSGNTTSGAGAHGGGIQFGGSGALTIVNSTISGNAASGATSFGGGLRIASGTAHLYNSTIVGNASTDVGGGVSADGSDTFVNTVVAGNTSGAGATAGASGSPLATGGVADDVSGTIEVATNSYFGTTVTITTDTGSLNGQGTDNLLLDDLADNGGHVLTHLPKVGSALIDAGSDAALPADAFDIDGDSDTAEKLPRDAIGNNRISAAVEIGAVEANDPPLASNDTAVTNEDTAVEVAVLANDSDSDGSIDSSSVVLGDAPAHGTAVVNASGSITYTPALNWNGADSFSYSVADDAGGRSNTATVTITINAINDLPVITGTASSVVNSGTPYGFAPTLSDVDSTTLTVSAANLPGWATLNASTGAITGTPSFADAGTYSGIVLTVSDGIGTSSLPPFAIVVVGTTDLDGDGMSDAFEQTHGLDPTDPSDAGGDLDSDGVSNLDEYLADRNPTVDDYPPVLSSPAPVTIDATGLLTPMPVLAAPSAVDGRDGALTATLVGKRTHLEPGTHILTWRATDAVGNRGETLQAVNVRPLISLARDVITAEGATARVRVMLNGLSPSYPLSVAYRVGGTAGADDHDLVAGNVVFEQGEIEKSIVVQIAKDDVVEGEETLEVSLTGEGNFGTQRTHTLRIVEGNVAPTLEWSIAQAGHSVRIVTQDRGPVTLSAAVHDANADDAHTYEWDLPASMTATNIGDSARMFDPAAMVPGVYRVELTVSDNGEPELSARSSRLFRVVASAPALSHSADSDGDGSDDATEGLIDQDGDGQPDYLDAIASPNVLNESAGDDGLFLIEADPEVMLSLGARAMAHGADGAHLTSGEIAGQGDIAPDSIANVGGYFDLTIRDLPEAGSSVNVVIPQRQAIPQHPLYRKLIDGQWMTFVENGANRLASSPGERGVCPPPGSSEYRAGLNPGDWCVRLTLEDGGPNDDDGIANRAVEDPGGVGVVDNVTTVPPVTHVTRGGGGGAMGTPLLMLLLLTALHRMRCSNAKRFGAMAMTLTLAVALALPAQANADERSLYVTGLLGQADTRIGKSDVEHAFAVQNIESTVHSVDSDRLAWGVGVGYAISDRWLVEAGYLDLGEVKLSFDAAAAETNLAQVHPLSGNGATISGLHQIRFGSRVTARARLGAFIWSSDYTTWTSGEQIDTDDDSGIDLLWGVALGYELSNTWTVNLELQRIEFDDPTHMIGLQAHWRIRPFSR